MGKVSECGLETRLSASGDIIRQSRSSSTDITDVSIAGINRPFPQNWHSFRMVIAKRLIRFGAEERQQEGDADVMGNDIRKVRKAPEPVSDE